MSGCDRFTEGSVWTGFTVYILNKGSCEGRGRHYHYYYIMILFKQFYWLIIIIKEEEKLNTKHKQSLPYPSFQVC